MDTFCIYCNKHFYSPAARRNHHRKKHPEAELVSMPEEVYRMHHINQGTPAAMSKYCNLCNKLYSSVYSKARHDQKKHPMTVLRKMMDEPVFKMAAFFNTQNKTWRVEVMPVASTSSS